MFSRTPKIKVLPPDWVVWAGALGSAIGAIYAAYAAQKAAFNYRGAMDLELEKLQFDLDTANRTIDVAIRGTLLMTKGQERIYVWRVALNPPSLAGWYICRYLQFPEDVPFEIRIDNVWGQPDQIQPPDLLSGPPLPIRLDTSLDVDPLVGLDTNWFKAAHWLTRKAFRISVEHKRGARPRRVLHWTTA